ncbi:MAG TPA: sulfotransferase [Euzebyales bacterium]|nr:sulfotransferase [Euzebyales bacterium]
MRLPNFVVIGAAKAGTTALYWYLAEQPQIHMSPLKETNFFAYGVDGSGRLLYGDPELHRFPIRTLRDYRELFDGAGEAMAVGEVSPIYLECPQAADRIAAQLPDARIVCGLRNPVDRAYSDYLMYLRKRGCRLDPQRDLTPAAAWARPDSHWIRIGRYHEHLSRYFAAHRRTDIHIYLFDDLRAQPSAVVQAIYRFLGVDDGFIPDLDTPHNVGGVPASMTFERVLTSKRVRAVVEPWIPQGVANAVRRVRTSNLQRAPALPAELRSHIISHYRDDIARTAEVIDRDLQHWTRVDA